MSGKREAVINGFARLNDLTRYSHLSHVFEEEHPTTLKAIAELHKKVTATAGQDADGNPDMADFRGIADWYSQDDNRYGKFLQYIHQAIRISAPLSTYHPNKGAQEHGVHEDRLELMTFLADQNPSWIRVYRNLAGSEALSRRERLALTEALGGHTVGSLPINRLLGSAGELIDLMETLPGQSSKKKVGWLATEYDAFEAQYGFDPSRIIAMDSVKETPQGAVTETTLSWWDDQSQRESRTVISTAPGRPQMPFSKLVEAVAQSRWLNPDFDSRAGKDVAAFCGLVLELSLPERLAGTPVGERMDRLSEGVESAMSRYAPEDYEKWLQRNVLSSVVMPILEDKVPVFFADNGFTHQVGDSGHVAATPLDSASPASVRYMHDDGVLMVTKYADSEGMRIALDQDYPGEPLQADKFLPSTKRVHLKALENKLTSLGVEENADQLAKLFCGELSPEDIPEVARWIRQCYHRPTDEEILMHAANALLDGHGVEMISALEIGDGADPCIEYVNQGDTYAPTLAWHNGDVFFTSYGDLLEAIEQRQADERERRDWSKMPITNPHPMPEPLTPLIEAAASEYLKQNMALEQQHYEAFTAPQM